MPDDIIIQYRFTDPDTGYSDAIVLPRAEFVAEYGALTKLDVDKIEAAKAARVANWRAALDEAKNAPPPDPKEEAQVLADQVAALKEQVATLEADLAVKVDALPAKDRPVVEVAEVVAEGK